MLRTLRDGTCFRNYGIDHRRCTQQTSMRNVRTFSVKLCTSHPPQPQLGRLSPLHPSRVNSLFATRPDACLINYCLVTMNILIYDNSVIFFNVIYT